MTDAGDNTAHLQAFTPTLSPAVVDLFAAEGWETYAIDPARTIRALSAPGCTTLVALVGARVVGLVQMQSDGEVQAHLSALLVASAWRRQGIARALLHEASTRAGGMYVDVLTKNPAFYESLGALPRAGFRLAPEQLALDEPSRPSRRRGRRGRTDRPRGGR